MPQEEEALAVVEEVAEAEEVEEVEEADEVEDLVRQREYMGPNSTTLELPKSRKSHEQSQLHWHRF